MYIHYSCTKSIEIFIAIASLRPANHVLDTFSNTLRKMNTYFYYIMYISIGKQGQFKVHLRYS